MNFDAATRTRIYADLTLTINPTGTTVRVSIDGTWYAATWQGTPVVSGSTWRQTARTTSYFAGHDVAAGAVAGAVVLATGRHRTKTDVTTSAGDILAEDSTPIDID